jgi:hypothetical protein
MKSPLVVCYGMGRDSTAMLVGYWQRKIRPDLIIFADVGAERQATYAYLAIINEWLEFVGFPPVTVVRYVAKNFKHWPHYHTIEENCLTNVTLPSLAYGGHSCSAKWKIAPQEAFLEEWQPAIDAWAAGEKVTKAVGFEDSPHEHRRTKRCSTFAIQDEDQSKVKLVFPLQEWKWSLARCIHEIEQAGLIVPPKSSCYFCPAMKPWEVDELPEAQLARIVIIESRTVQRHLASSEERGWPKGEGVPLIEGLWRRRVKGMRGATPKPGSMTEYIREKGLLPAAQVDRLIELTPTDYIKQTDFEAAGIADWQDWLGRIIEQSKEPHGTQPQLGAALGAMS